MFKNVNRSPEANEGGGFESLTNTIDFSPNTTTSTDTSTAIEEVVSVNDNIEKFDIGELPGGFSDTPATETKETEKKEEVKEEEKLEFQVPSEVSWINIAKEDGIEIKDNDQKAYKEALKEKLRNEELATLPADVKDYVEHVKAGGKIEDFKEPFNNIEKLKALSAEELVTLDLQNTEGWTEEMIETEVALQIENNTIDHSAAKLRLILDQTKESIKNDIIQTQQARQTAEAERIANEVKIENESIHKSIDEFKEFMGIPTNEKQKQFIKKKWDDGSLKAEFSNSPKDVIEFAAWKYFGQQGQEMLKKEYLRKGKDEIQAKLSNVPPKTESTGRKIATQASNDFENLKFD